MDAALVAPPVCYCLRDHPRDWRRWARAFCGRASRQHHIVCVCVASSGLTVTPCAMLRRQTQQRCKWRAGRDSGAPGSNAFWCADRPVTRLLARHATAHHPACSLERPSTPSAPCKGGVVLVLARPSRTTPRRYAVRCAQMPRTLPVTMADQSECIRSDEKSNSSALA